MVGDDLRIRCFTPLAEKVMNFCATDIGRRLAEIRPNSAGVDLDGIVRNTIETTTPHEQEVQAEHDRYLMRVGPYKTWNNKIEGAVITFLDIEAVRPTLEETRRQQSSRTENRPRRASFRCFFFGLWSDSRLNVSQL
jgi:two-component system CheB/CheR fusion protein